MRALVLAVLVMVAGSDWSGILKDAEKQVPRIEIADGGGKGICSGAVVQPEPTLPPVVLTAAHCVSPTAEVTVNGRHASVAQFNHILDLAVLEFRVKKELVLPIAQTDPVLGSEVAILGFPFGSETFHAQQGIVAAPYDRECKCLKLNADVIPGDSGGAVVNSKGELVGLTAAIYFNGPAHLGAAVPLSVVKDFLDDYVEKAKKRK